MEHEIQRLWRRSSRCILPDSACVEIAISVGAELEPGHTRIHVRDSKVGDKAVLTFGAESWNDFLAAVKAGEFDLA